MTPTPWTVEQETRGNETRLYIIRTGKPVAWIARLRESKAVDRANGHHIVTAANYYARLMYFAKLAAALPCPGRTECSEPEPEEAKRDRFRCDGCLARKLLADIAASGDTTEAVR